MSLLSNQLKDTFMHPLLQQLTVARATTLARAGDFAAAASTLQPGGELLRDPAAFDLMARISAQQGDHAEAHSLWTQVLKVDPSNRSAIAGIEGIRRRRRGVSWGALTLPLAILGTAWIVGNVIISTSQQHQIEAGKNVAALADSNRTVTTALAESNRTMDALGQRLLALEEAQNKGLSETRSAVEKTTTETLATLSGQAAVAGRKADSLQTALGSLSMQMETIITKHADLENKITTTQKEESTALKKELGTAQTRLATQSAADIKILTEALKSLEQKIEVIKPASPASQVIKTSTETK